MLGGYSLSEDYRNQNLGTVRWLSGLKDLLPWTIVVKREKKNLLKGYSDLHTCTILYMHTHVLTHTHINFTKK